MVRINSYYDRVRPKGLDFPKDDPGSVSMTKQSFAAECDINNIMKKYDKTRLLPIKVGEPMFGDFSNVEDLHKQESRIAILNENFAKLPAVVRDRFKNSPAVLIEFLADSKNEEEAIKLGLLPKKEVVAPPVADKAPADSATPVPKPA